MKLRFKTPPRYYRDGQAGFDGFRMGRHRSFATLRSAIRGVRLDMAELEADGVKQPLCVNVWPVASSLIRKLLQCGSVVVLCGWIRCLKREAMVKKEQDKDLKAAFKEIEKKFGAGAVTQLGKSRPPNLEVISTGILSLDYAIRQADPEHKIDLGGIPRGRITEVYGPESSGKSSILMQVMGVAQRMGLGAGLIDAEHSFDANYARKLGVNVEDLVVSQPDYGEQALEIVESLLRSSWFGLIVVDSVAALVPQAELEGEFGDAHPGLQARLVTQGLRKLNTLVKDTKVALVFVNQIREKIAVSWGSNETTTGGRALRHYASLRLDVRKKETLKLSDKPVGSRVKFRVAKNKIDSPFREAEVDFLYGRGFNAAGDLIDFGVELGVLVKEGAKFSLNGDKLCSNGREVFRSFLESDADLAGKLYAAIRQRIGVQV